MTLPTSRNITINAADPIPSSLLNGLQDCIVGQKKPILTRVFGPFGGTAPNPLAPAALNSSAGIAGTQNYVVSTGASSFMVYFPCETGDRILGLTCRAFGDGVADTTFTAGYFDGSGVLQTLGTLVDNNRAAAWGDAVLAGPWTNRTLLAGELVGCFVAINAANYRVQKWILSYDRP